MYAEPYFNEFKFPLEGEGGSYVEDMVQDWIGQKKKIILATISYLYICCNKDLIRAMLPIYYGTSSLTF